MFPLLIHDYTTQVVKDDTKSSKQETKENNYQDILTACVLPKLETTKKRNIYELKGNPWLIQTKNLGKTCSIPG